MRIRGADGVAPAGLLETFVEGVDDVDGQDGRTGSSDVSLDTPSTRGKPRGRRIQGRCRAEPATVLDVECRRMFGDEGRRASREVRRKSPRRKKQGAAPRLHTQIPTRMDLKSIILKL